jgi:hypothetical protein
VKSLVPEKKPEYRLGAGLANLQFDLPSDKASAVEEAPTTIPASLIGSNDHHMLST